MRSLLVLFAAVVLVGGCAKQPENTAVNATPPKPPGAPQNGGGIAPIGPNVGAMTPVGGAENLGSGTGGGVGQAAKDSAKRLGNKAANPTGTGEDESGGQ